MAERRMFTKKIVDSDAFLDMPLSTQALYFHLAMRADDDGFINNPKKIMRMIGASDDELKVLLTKRFILIFESGVIVIKHWKMHNYIQNDRYRPSQYIQEKQLLELKDNKAYTEKSKDLDTKCIQSGRLGKDSIELVEYSIEENNTPSDKPDYVFLFSEFWKLYPNKKDKAKSQTIYIKKLKDAKDHNALHKLILNGLKNQIDYYNKSIRLGKFTPNWKNPPTWLRGECWIDELDEIKLNADKGEVLSDNDKMIVTNITRLSKGLQKRFGLEFSESESDIMRKSISQVLKEIEREYDTLEIFFRTILRRMEDERNKIVNPAGDMLSGLFGRDKWLWRLTAKEEQSSSGYHKEFMKPDENPMINLKGME